MTDQYDDPFDEDVHDPVSFALNGATLMYERAQTFKQDFEKQVAKADPAMNIMAVSARKAIREPLQKLVEQATTARGFAAALRAVPEDQLDGAFEKFYAAYNEANKTLADVERLARSLLTPDGSNGAPQEPPMPGVRDWNTVSALVLHDTTRWASNVRGQKGKLLILNPSAGTGKTYAMMHVALTEQANRQRVVVAVRTKQMLAEEAEPRLRKAAYGPVRLHVIQGRDESTCWNYDNVKAVQEHGYSPGSAVCSRCEYHPDIAKKLRTYMTCPYYRTRQSAQNDSAAARLGLHEYPVILTTHAGYLSAVESGGGRFGKFWPCDLLMVDEDPTDAFEPTVTIAAKHLTLPTPPRPEDRAAHAMAALMRAAMDQANAERKAAESRGWKDAGGKPHPVHGRYGSAYASNDLHALLDRAAFILGMNAVKVMRDASDSHVHPAAGALHGATTPEAVSLVAPPRGLSQIGEALFEENAFRMQLRRIAYKKLYDRELSTSLTSAQLGTAIEESAEFHPVYRVRLEFSPKDGEWRFVLQSFTSMLDQGTNIIQGDAYANIEHYRQLYDKPATMPSDPNYIDPVTVINHIAQFPEGSLLVRIRTKANITYLRGEGKQDHFALVAEVLRAHAGLTSVLVYGHKDQREHVEKLFADNDNFGIRRWAFENWGGGRGKDQYGDFDAVVTISDYVPSLAGTLHTLNARAARDTARLLARGKIDEALIEATRIRLDMSQADVAHKMADPDTHWRIRQENERQSINEQAQALHRVRGLRSPKRMTVIGDGVPFTKDTIAASAVVNPPGGPAGRQKLKSGYLDGGLTVEEHFTAICEVADQLGCWSPVFSHALLASEVASFLDLNPLFCHRDKFCQKVADQTGSKGVEYHLYNYSLYRDGTQPPDSLSHPLSTDMSYQFDSGMPGVPGMPGDHVLLRGLLDRVWFPPAEWKLLYQRALRHLKRLKSASAMVSREFAFSGRYVPSWEGSAHPGYMWYSRHSAKTGASSAVDILEHQYGPRVNGVLYAPKQRDRVPF